MRTMNVIVDEISAKNAKARELRDEAEGIKARLETNPDDAGLRERVNRVTAGIKNVTADLAELQREGRQATAALPPEAFERGDGANPNPIDRTEVGGKADPSRVTKETVALNQHQSLAAWGKVNGAAADTDVTMAGMIRGLQFGVWGDAENRAIRNQGSLVGSEGGFLVPAGLSLSVLDLARNQARVQQAGATVVPMPTPQYSIARVAGDPSTAWRKESAAVSETEATFEKLTLTARTLSALVKIPLELIEDTIGGGGRSVEPLIQNLLAEAIALEVDRVALLGDGDDGEPVGLKETSGVSTASLSAAPSDWDFVVDRAGIVEDNNFTVSSGITSPRVGRQLGKLKDTTNQPLRRPERVGYPLLETNQVPVDLGASDNESLLFVGDFAQLILGVRTQLQLIPLRERFMDNGEIGLIAWFRGDVGIARTGAFAIEDAITA